MLSAYQTILILHNLQLGCILEKLPLHTKSNYCVGSPKRYNAITLCEVHGLGTDTQLSYFLKCRGPDCQSTCKINLSTVDLNKSYEITLQGSVLWMQGPEPTLQPIETDKGILLFNGDIFNETWFEDKCDTEVIMRSIMQDMNSDNNELHITNVIRSLKGPFSIIFIDKLCKKIFFSRDRLGRNSLLLHKNADCILLSSVLNRNYIDSIELPPSQIFSIDLQSYTIDAFNWTGTQIDRSIGVDEWLKAMRQSECQLDSKPQCISIVSCDHDFVNEVSSLADNNKCRKTVMDLLLKNTKIDTIVDNIIKLLERSVSMRIKTQPSLCKNCIHINQKELCVGHACVGVLFSGGLDCTILALIADKYVPKDQPIDLLNVAFAKDGMSEYNVPDRETGRIAVAELKMLCPDRLWNLIEINIPSDELRAEQKLVIADLVYPKKTVLDESLGSALWFAARGTSKHQSSTCRVLLLGMGADELFGGYLRHRNALKRKSWKGLHEELFMDWNRIAYRNLARDNRVVAHHGRQPRMPYLDEDFTKYVLNLKPWERCIPNESCEPGFGDKLYLRLAAFKLGLRNVAFLPKRAIQFGSRIANKKENGNDLSERFMNLNATNK